MVLYGFNKWIDRLWQYQTHYFSLQFLSVINTLHFQQLKSYDMSSAIIPLVFSSYDCQINPKYHYYHPENPIIL
jgi:hypothetical protein